MIKIEEIVVRGYKNIESASLKLNNFNVIIGPNNSGKSNFIQTISFLNYIVNSSLDDLETNFKNGFDSTYLKEIIPLLRDADFRNVKNIDQLERTGLISIALIISNTTTNRVFSYSLDIEWQSEIIDNNYKIVTETLDVKEPTKPGPSTNIFNRTNGNVKYGAEFSKKTIIEKVPDHFSVVRFLKIIGDIRIEYKDAIDSLNEIIKTPIFYFSHIELLKTDKERLNSFNGRIVSFELGKEIVDLEGGTKWNIFKDAIRNILNIEEVVVHQIAASPNNELRPSKYLYFTHQGSIKSLGQFSDGTLLIIALVTKIISTKNSLFLIEEPENSTHPRALVDLLAFIKSFSENTQFIITSHSIAIVNKTSIEDIIVSSMNENGLCEFYNVSSKKELKTRLKKSRINFSDELFFGIDDKNEFV